MCKLAAEASLIFSSSLQHSRWRRMVEDFRAFHFMDYFQNAEDGVCTQESTWPLNKFLEPASPDLLYYYFNTGVLPSILDQELTLPAWQGCPDLHGLYFCNASKSTCLLIDNET